MVVEEPSIVAACSSISKLIAQNGGFYATSSTRNITTAQIQILNIKNNDTSKACQLIIDNQSKLIEIGNTYCKRMVARGGGIVKVEFLCARVFFSKNNCEISKKNCFLVVFQ